MKVYLRSPKPSDLEPLLLAARHTQASLETGSIFEHTPRSFRFGRTQQRVGSGRADFEHAQQLVSTWAFLPRWASVYPAAAAQESGTFVLLVVKTLFVKSVLPARIIESIAEEHRAGFVYAALPGHVAQGYERFVVELDPATGDVTFELAAVARPTSRLVRLVRPAFSLIQLHFRRTCMRQLRAAIRQAATGAAAD